eukprot:gene22413-34326_t
MAYDDAADTPLWEAAAVGNVERVRELLCFGEDPDKRYEGQTSLMFAAAGGHLAACQLLIANGADVHLRDSYQQTSLHWAARKKRPEIVRLLLSEGSDPHARSILYGETPADIARLSGDVVLVRLLVYELPSVAPSRRPPCGVDTKEAGGNPAPEPPQPVPKLPRPGVKPPVQPASPAIDAAPPPVVAPPIPERKRVPPPPERLT